MKTVTFRPYTLPNYFLFVSNDSHRSHGLDFDVRVHPHLEQRNQFILQNLQGNIYTIKSAVNQDHYLFCSNDGIRCFGSDFDVRTHPHAHEQINQWIIKPTQSGTFTISSCSNPEQKIFVADDGANQYGDDFDVRTHIYDELRNQWFIDGFFPQQQQPFIQQGNYQTQGIPQTQYYSELGQQNTQQYYQPQQSFQQQQQQPYQFQESPKQQLVTIRSYVHPSQYLFISNDFHRAFGSDFDVRTHKINENRNKWILEIVQGNIFLIRSAENLNHYLFCSNDFVRMYGSDFDVRTHISMEQRNNWKIMQIQPGVFIISSYTNPEHYLFCADDRSNAYEDDFDVRTHIHIEERNKWIIDGFQD